MGNCQNTEVVHGSYDDWYGGGQRTKTKEEKYDSKPFQNKINNQGGDGGAKEPNKSENKPIMPNNKINNEAMSQDGGGAKGFFIFLNRLYGLFFKLNYVDWTVKGIFHKNISLIIF